MPGQPSYPNTGESPPQTSGDRGVLVVGGGPAGSTAAALLAERGFEVTLLEKDHHPRFHIGESLLPLNLPLFQRLGIAAEIERIGMPKWGVDFVSPTHGRSVTFEFADAWNKALPYSFQVRRSQLDHILLNNAVAKGATVIEGWRATELDLAGAGVQVTAQSATGEQRRWRARFLVDASGRDTLVANKLGLKDRNQRHASAAIYGHFTGARRQQGRAEGNISIFWFEHGWIWFIPLADGTTSVGAVCPPDYLKSRKTDVTSFFRDTIATAPALAERLSGAVMTGPVTATGNYSYQARSMVGRNYLLVGDAYAFIDPVFSTGVYLAMNSAFRAADTVATVISSPHHAATALTRFDAEVRRGIDRFAWFIYRMNQPALRDLFMNPRNILRMREAMLSMLSGDVFGASPVHRRLAVFKALYYAKTLHCRPAGVAKTVPRTVQPMAAV
ncbi:NAD(P)/FAD-dependent oxidoreductase [Rhodopila sp.]|uniref:NAD(P)/FAD-dependent oxidoreductase n=1 Tax=Rhodopila sp. TaxID=2480087 RepID=UPI003D12751D